LVRGHGAPSGTSPAGGQYLVVGKRPTCQSESTSCNPGDTWTPLPARPVVRWVVPSTVYEDEKTTAAVAGGTMHT
jgi:hypothetical protein